MPGREQALADLEAIRVCQRCAFPPHERGAWRRKGEEVRGRVIEKEGANTW